jgi:hypothetical protein
MLLNSPKSKAGKEVKLICQRRGKLKLYRKKGKMQKKYAVMQKEYADD